MIIPVVNPFQKTSFGVITAGWVRLVSRSIRIPWSISSSTLSSAGETNISWCSRCRHLNPQEDLNCENCGNAFASQRKLENFHKALSGCAEYGEKVPAEVSYCPNCGIEFSSTKVKCSQCKAWIDDSLARYPESGVEFGS